MFLTNRLNVLLIGIVGILSQVVVAEYPDDPKPCKYGDSECIANIINYLTREKQQGDPNLGVIELDPLRVGKMSINQGAESAVNIDLTFTDNDILGLHGWTVYKVKGFGKDLTKKHEIFVRYKSTSLVGPYTINGRILVLPIKGSGVSNITMIDTEMLLSFKGEPYEKDGETYMKLKDVNVRFKPTRLHFHFSNLFNGDKALGDNMNAFLNENWRDIYNEVEKSVSTAFAKVFENLINLAFAKYPYNKYFVE